jgi:large subunit ribosomal protein L25
MRRAACAGPDSCRQSFTAAREITLRLLSIQSRFKRFCDPNTILKLDIAGHGAANAILKNWQVDPVKETFLHADFYRIAMDVAIRVTVPIHAVGEARGVKVDGGILELVVRAISVECLPGDIPERIDVDVSELGINESLRVSDIQFPAKVKVLEAPDQVVVHVVAVKEEVAPAAAAAAPVAEGEAAASSTEPEVIKKGKKEEEEPKAE